MLLCLVCLFDLACMYYVRMCSDPRPGGWAAPETGGHLHPANPHWHSALHAHHLQPVPGAHRHSPAGAASALGRVSMAVSSPQ